MIVSSKLDIDVDVLTKEWGWVAGEEGKGGFLMTCRLALMRNGVLSGQIKEETLFGF